MLSRNRSVLMPFRTAGFMAVLSAFLHVSGGPLVSDTVASGALPQENVPAVIARAAEFVAAVNDSSFESWSRAARSIYAESYLERVGEQALAEQLGRLHRDYAPLVLHHGEVTASALHVFARSVGAAGWKDFQFYVDMETPHRLLQLVFIADTAEPVYLPNGDIRSPATIEWLDQYIETLVEKNDLSGRILIGKGEQSFVQKEFGHLDATGARPVVATTRFNLASGNKMFTAVAILMLVEEGTLRLGDPVGRVLPDFPDAELGAKITVHQLLSHSSGLGDFLQLFWEEGGDVTRLRDAEPFVYRELAEHGIWFEPGTQHRYSNSGFLLLGRIIEEVSGEDYFDFVRSRIYTPLGMEDTDSYLLDGSVSDLAPALTKPLVDRSDGGQLNGAPLWVETRRGVRGTSAGGGFSTPADIFRFLRGLLAGTLVSRETLAEMTRPQPPGVNDGAGGFADGYAYGLGFELERTRSGVVSWGHGGTAPGVNFSLRYFPAQDITLILFNNQDNGAYDDLRRNTAKLITGDR